RATSQAVFPVLDADGRFHGILTRDDLHGLMLDRSVDLLVLAADLMSGADACARADEDMPAVLRRLGRHHLDELPLIDDQRRLLGLVTRTQLTDAYRRAVERLAAEPDELDRSASRG
nr:CBS domain-containing protein [Planctomycetota bacterium]